MAAPEAPSTDCSASLGVCIAREVAAGGHLQNLGSLQDAFIVNGAISDIVQLKTESLPGVIQALLSDPRKLSPAQFLAATTLAAAAFNSADPYADPEWLAVAKAFRDDPAVALRAAHIIRDLGYEPWEDVLRDPPGLTAIWKTVVAHTPEDNDQLLDLAHDLSFYGPESQKPQIKLLLDRFLASPNRTPEQLATAASLLANTFDDADAAQALMDAGGYRATDHEVSSEDNLLAVAAARVAAEHGETDGTVSVIQEADIAAKDAAIAVTRLWMGVYSASDAQLVADRLILDDSFQRQATLDAMRRGGAITELREVGDGWLRRARAARQGVSDAAQPLAGDVAQLFAGDAGQLFAGASDAYRFAGEPEKAIAAAREGMPLIPLALDNRPDIPDMVERRRLAGDDNGMSIAPAISLYLAGAESEAMASGYVSGLQLLQAWDRPLADFDPLWLAQDTPKWFDVTIWQVLDSKDPAFSARVHEALVRTPGAAQPMQLAVLAAAAGKTAEAQAHLDASLSSARANDPDRHPSDGPYLMLRTVMAQKVCEMLLAEHAAR